MNDQVVFSPGEIIKTIRVPVNPDHECETDETFYLDLSGVENANLLLHRSQATIKNDDNCSIFLPAIHNNYKNIIYFDYFNSDGGWEEVSEMNSDWFVASGNTIVNICPRIATQKPLHQSILLY